jgi:hypothetical protein
MLSTQFATLGPMREKRREDLGKIGKGMYHLVILEDIS